MKYDNMLNILGLISNIIGVVLLFKFGLPEQVNKDGHINLTLEQKDEGEKEKAKKYDFYGSMGLILIIIGFVFQLIGNLI